MNTDTRTNVCIQCGAIVGLILIIIALVFMRGCESKPQLAENIDSLKVAYAIERNQFNHAQSMLLSEITAAAKLTQQLKSENIALQARTKIVEGNYTALLKRVRNSAPIDCQSYIDSVDIECNKVVVAKDNEIGKLAAIVINQDSIVLKQMDLIGLQTEQLSKDSSHVAALNRHITTLDSEVSQANKRAKWAKFWGKVAIGAAVVYTGVVMYFTVVK